MGPDGRAGIDAALVRRLIAEQFPAWRDLPVTPVDVDGWDNRTYRLGDGLSVRLPTAAHYVAAVEKEQRWLPVLAAQLPLPVPVPVALGAPGHGYPHPWSVRRWLDGETADASRIGDGVAFARALAAFLLGLNRADTTGGPAAGAHSFFRGGSLGHYDEEARVALAALADARERDRAKAGWEAAIRPVWDEPAVWFHGDVAAGNLLVVGGRLAAVIDFGTSGVGDPACDLVIAWTLLGGVAREAFREVVGHDAATWARARGWALWKALIELAGAGDPASARAELNRRVIATVIADHELAVGP